MSLLTLFRQEEKVAPRATESLEDVLIELSKWGKPRIGQYGIDGKWHCSIEVRVNATGISFEAQSSFKHETPMEAAIECRKNLHDAVRVIGGAP